MLTLKRRRNRRVPPRGGRGAILGLFFCFAQCSILAVGVSSGLVVLLSASPKPLSSHSEGQHYALPRKRNGWTWEPTSKRTSRLWRLTTAR
jgi:hypothetical protein